MCSLLYVKMSCWCCLRAQGSRTVITVGKRILSFCQSCEGYLAHYILKTLINTLLLFPWFCYISSYLHIYLIHSSTCLFVVSSLGRARSLKGVYAERNLPANTISRHINYINTEPRLSYTCDWGATTREQVKSASRGISVVARHLRLPMMISTWTTKQL